MASGQQTASGQSDEEYIYHERQVAAICAVHALNSLVQGPAFSEIDLAAIAKDLDERETALLMTSGHDNPDLLRMIADGSSNVDDSGNFSIEVIRSALERFDLQLSASDMDSVVQNAHSYDAFILNLEQHWFTIRRIAGRFWNLDSTKKQPQAVSEFFLSAFLSQMRQEGYSIFVVQGALPKDQAGNAPLQNLFSIDAILRGDKDAHFSGGSPAPEGDEVQQLASAVAADPTLHEAAVQSIMERRQLPRAEAEMMLVMAISSVPPLVPAAAPAPAASSGADGDDDDQLAQAIALSLS